MEVVSQGVIAKNETFLTEDRLDTIYKSAEELGRMLSGLKAKLSK